MTLERDSYYFFYLNLLYLSSCKTTVNEIGTVFISYISFLPDFGGKKQFKFKGELLQ